MLEILNGERDAYEKYNQFPHTKIEKSIQDISVEICAARVKE